MEMHRREDLSHPLDGRCEHRSFAEDETRTAELPDYGLPRLERRRCSARDGRFPERRILKTELTPERFRSRAEDYFGKSMLPWLHRTFPDFLVLPDGKRAKYLFTARDGLVEISARLETCFPSAASITSRTAR